MQQHSKTLLLLYCALFSVYQTLRSIPYAILSFFQLIPKPLPAQLHPKAQKSGILITGTSSGIGKNLVLSLLKRGYTVFATVRKDQDADVLRKEAIKMLGNGLGGGDLFLLNMDVRHENTIDDCVQQINDWTAVGDNKLIAVINNAAVVESLPMEITPMEKIEQIIDTNFLGVVRVCKATLPLLRQSHGRIVVIGSLNGDVGVPLLSSYCASKHALEGWCDAVRAELIPQNVQISLVKPGTIDTPVFEKTLAESDYISRKLPTQAKSIAESWGIDPGYVSMSVIHAIESKFPQTRYIVGIDAFLVSIARPFIPDRLFDFGLLSFFWLSSSAGKKLKSI